MRASQVENLNQLESDFKNDKRPNTYTFTKAIAESVIVKECGDLPCCIVRPSIIGSSWKEPFPGWVDSFYGPAFSIVTIGTGLFRTMVGNNAATCDIIPIVKKSFSSFSNLI